VEPAIKRSEGLRKIVAVALIGGYFGAFLLVTAALGYRWYITDRAPDQPIAFPHTIHVSRLGIPCTFCHIYAERSKFAGVPFLNKCMACHKTLATEREEIKKLTRYFNEKKPVVWKRVYELPPHVYFTHKRHVKKGVKCTTCHGEVGTMKKIRKVSSLDMGWCVSCHKDRGVLPLDCATCHK
jgi:hypothetical protein